MQQSRTRRLGWHSLSYRERIAAVWMVITTAQLCFLIFRVWVVGSTASDAAYDAAEARAATEEIQTRVEGIESGIRRMDLQMIMRP